MACLSGGRGIEGARAGPRARADARATSGSSDYIHMGKTSKSKPDSKERKEKKENVVSAAADTTPDDYYRQLGFRFLRILASLIVFHCVTVGGNPFRRAAAPGQ